MEERTRRECETDETDFYIVTALILHGNNNTVNIQFGKREKKKEACYVFAFACFSHCVSHRVIVVVSSPPYHSNHITKEPYPNLVCCNNFVDCTTDMLCSQIPMIS